VQYGTASSHFGMWAVSNMEFADGTWMSRCSSLQPAVGSSAVVGTYSGLGWEEAFGAVGRQPSPPGLATRLRPRGVDGDRYAQTLLPSKTDGKGRDCRRGST
jgi:hypothetical protein